MSGGPLGRSGAGPKKQPEHQFGWTAGTVRSAAGWFGLEPGLARPRAEMDSPKTK
jgi:hypothetical protein